MYAAHTVKPPLDYANDPDFDLGLDEYGIDPALSKAGIAVSVAALAVAAVGGFFLGKAVLDHLDPPKPQAKPKRSR